MLVLNKIILNLTENHKTSKQTKNLWKQQLIKTTLSFVITTWNSTRQGLGTHALCRLLKQHHLTGKRDVILQNCWQEKDDGSCRADGRSCSRKRQSRIVTGTQTSHVVPYVSNEIPSLYRRTITLQYVDGQICYSVMNVVWCNWGNFFFHFLLSKPKRRDIYVFKKIAQS